MLKYSEQDRMSCEDLLESEIWKRYKIYKNKKFNIYE